jgi:hypothetical protein
MIQHWDDSEVVTGKVTAAHKIADGVSNSSISWTISSLTTRARPIHVIFDNLNTHKPKNDRWLKRHSNAHFHFTSTRRLWPG